jgi:hypothetical protein
MSEGIDILSEEILVMIIEYMDIYDQISLAMTCKKLRRLALEIIGKQPISRLDETFYRSIQRNEISHLRWLILYGHKIIDGNIVMKAIVESENKQMFDLLKQYDLLHAGSWCYQKFIRKNSLEWVQLLYHAKIALHEWILEIAVAEATKTKDTRIVEFLLKKNCPINTRTKVMVQNCRLTPLKKLFENKG